MKEQTTFEDICEAASRLLAREAETAEQGAAIRFAEQLFKAHEDAGLKKEAEFWEEVLLQLMGEDIGKTLMPQLSEAYQADNE